MAERDIFEKYDNLREDEPNAKSNKNVDVKSDVMNTVIKPCRGEKKEAKEKQNRNRNLIFEEKKQEVLENQLDCKFIRTNTRRL